MRTVVVLLLALSNGAAQASAREAPVVVQAASSFVGDIVWQERSVVVGDFTCQGKKQHAILGTTKSVQVMHEGVAIGETHAEVVLAVFAHGLTEHPEVLHFPVQNGKTARLTVESLTSMPAELPEGWHPSKVCKGLNVGDGERDSAHVYWNRARRAFSVWSF
jgi:hypothetical protein